MASMANMSSVGNKAHMAAIAQMVVIAKTAKHPQWHDQHPGCFTQGCFKVNHASQSDEGCRCLSTGPWDISGKTVVTSLILEARAHNGKAPTTQGLNRIFFS